METNLHSKIQKAAVQQSYGRGSERQISGQPGDKGYVIDNRIRLEVHLF